MDTEDHGTEDHGVEGHDVKDHGRADEDTEPIPTASIASGDAPGLRRSTTKRMIGGVAGGIAERFDMDANIVRAIFIILTFVWGAGIAVYLALWALVPKSGDADTSALGQDGVQPAGMEWTRWQISALFAGAVVFGVIIWAYVLGNPRFGGGLTAVWLIFLVVLAVLSLRRPASRTSVRRLVITFFLVVVSLLILLAGAFFGYIASTGVPIAGGVGQKVYTPTSIAQVQSTYRTAFGSMTIDLRQVPFGHRTLAVTASVAAGDLVVEVPPTVSVDVSAESGTPHIAYPQGYSSFYGTTSVGVVRSHLVLNAKVGIGQIELIRAAPGVPE